ncbi:MAG: YbjN domain-containing protein [Candidatus Sumerlaeota bacterium]|nr:YbjN domain-containing protein [Candidatus Sumerlaeota bacterium]
MGQIYEAILEHLEAEGMRYRRHDEDEVVVFGITGRNGQWEVLVRARQDMERLTILSHLPFSAPETKRGAMAELICRANFGLVIGNFKLDMNDGEIRYKTSLALNGEPLHARLLGPVFDMNFGTMDRYIPAILKVMYGNSSPAEAIAEIEGSSRAPVTSKGAEGECAQDTEGAKPAGTTLEELRRQFEAALAAKAGATNPSLSSVGKHDSEEPSLAPVGRTGRPS